MRTKKQVAIWICFLALLFSCMFSPAAFALEGEPPSDQSVSEGAPSQEPESEEGVDEPVDGDTPAEPPPSDPEQEPKNNIYTINLDTQTIGNGGFSRSRWKSFCCGLLSRRPDRGDHGSNRDRIRRKLDYWHNVRGRSLAGQPGHPGSASAGRVDRGEGRRQSDTENRGI